MRLIGLDPGLRTTGWGVVEVEGSRIRHVANGQVQSDAEAPTATRLCRRQPHTTNAARPPHLHGVGELVHAAQHRRASLHTKHAAAFEGVTGDWASRGDTGGARNAGGGQFRYVADAA